MDSKNVKLLDLEATKELVTKLTPSNKEVLDKLSDENGNLQYNEIALLNGEKVTRAQYKEMVTNGTLKDITYIVTDDSSDVEDDSYITRKDIDEELSETSTNPVQNKTVYIALNKTVQKTDITNNLTTTKAGNVLDATQGYELNKQIVNISSHISHNIPRITPKDITSYISDGSFYKRLNGTDGFELFEDIYVGDYIEMSRSITCADSYNNVTGSKYVTIIGLNTLKYNGDSSVNYNHAVMTAGKGFEGTQHFGRHAMNTTNTTEGGYAGSQMDKNVLGTVVTAGSTASGATINQQLYAEFGAHLKTTKELVSISVNSTGMNRFGTASGCSNNWAWQEKQAILMSEIEVYGSIVWSSSGYDTGVGKMQMPLFKYSREAMNNISSYYWLKDVATAAYFCICNNYGNASYNSASNVNCYVRPRFVIAA